MCKLWPMKTHTIIMMLTLVVAGLVIGCSSEPAAPVANLTEEEVIAIARSSEGRDGCFRTTAPKDEEYGPFSLIDYVSFTNFAHSQYVSFKPSGIWIVTAKSSWAWENGKIFDSDIPNWSEKKPEDSGVTEHECTVIVDDATGRVTSN